MTVIHTTRLPRVACWACCFILTACTGFQAYEPAPVDVERTFPAIQAYNLDDPGLAQYMWDHGYVYDVWPLKRWDLRALTLAALYFNPQMQIARAEWARSLAAETTAGQQPNPTLNLPLEWHSDTSGDRSPWTVGLVLDLILERHGKRQARLDQAVMQSLAHRVEAEHTAWRIRSRVVDALLNDISAEELHASLQSRLEIAGDILDVLEQRRLVGEISDFELSAARLELQRTRLAMVEQKRARENALADLAAAVGLAPESLRAVELVDPDLENLPIADELPSIDVRGLALLQRYDIRKALAEYSAREAVLRLEIEKQYPDIILSPGFIFDQNDLIWTMGAAWLLPLLHRNEGEIAEALAARDSQRQALLGLQTRILQEVHKARNDYIARYESYLESLHLRDDAFDYMHRIRQQFKAGHADRLQELRARFELNQTERTTIELRFAMLRAFAELENALQFPLQWPVPLPEPQPLSARAGQGTAP